MLLRDYAFSILKETTAYKSVIHKTHNDLKNSRVARYILVKNPSYVRHPRTAFWKTIFSEMAAVNLKKDGESAERRTQMKLSKHR